MESYCKKGPKSIPSKAHTFDNSTESIKITKIEMLIWIKDGSKYLTSNLAGEYQKT